jgi:serine protease Do
MVANRKPGEKIRLMINRDGKDKELTVKLGEAEQGASTSRAAGENQDSESGRMAEDLGLSYQDLDPETARRYGIDTDLEGLLITEVDPASDAFRKANLRRGQIIVAVNGDTVQNTGELEQAYAAVQAGATFLVRVVQPDGSGTMVTALRKPD